MTAINVLRFADEVIMITDGIGVDRFGRVSWNVQKVMPIAHLPAVIATRGPGELKPYLGARIGMGFTTFDDVRAGLVDLLRAEEPVIAASCSLAPVEQHLDIVVAGISATRGPDSFLVTTNPNHGEAAPPWQIVDLPEIMLAPDPGRVALQSGQSLDDDDAPLRLDLHLDAVAIVQAQRALPRVGFGAGGLTAPVAGGFVQVTRVHLDGRIETRVVHRFEETT